MRGDETDVSADEADRYAAGTTEPILATGEARALAHVRANMLGGRHRQSEVGRYRLLSRLGAGGMGVVWRALDPELDRHVAIKLVRPASAIAPEMNRRRLLREARSLARLVHPNVVRVFDVGHTEQGVFLAMELLPGPTLVEWVWQPQPWREVLRLLVPVARGLAHAHEQGLCHRDIKPDNIMWADGRLVVTDFGLAAAEARPEELVTEAAEDRIDTEVLTEAGMGVGTPAYMAPEQHDAEADVRSDVYALCVVIWEALCGAPAFRGRSMQALAAAKRAMRLPPLPDDVPRWVVRALRKGLAPDPDERCPSMAELADALEPRRRSRLGWILAGAATLASAALLPQLLPSAETPAPLSATMFPDTPSAPSVDATAIETLALLADVQQQAGDLDGADQTVQAVEAWAEELAEPDARLTALAARGSWLNASGDLESAESTLARAYFLAVSEQAPRIAVESAARLVHAAASRGEYVTARQWLNAGRSWAGLEPPAEASARLSNSEGSLLAAEGKYEEAAAAFEDAVWGWRASLGPEHPHVALALSNLGNVLDWQGRYEAAIQRHLEALQIEEAQLGATHPHTAATRLNLGSVRRSMGDYEGALIDYRVALEIHREAYGPRSAMTARTLDSIGDILGEMGATQDAVEHHRQAVQILEDAVGDDHPDLVGPLSNLGGTQLQAGDTDVAIATLSRARVLAERRLGVDHSGTATVLSNLGHAHRIAGKPQRALELHRRALEIREDVFGAMAPVLARSLTGLGECELELGLPRDAVKSFERALAIRSASGVGQDLLAEARFGLARALASAGDDLPRAHSLAHAASVAYERAGDDAAVQRVATTVRDWGETD